MASEILENMLSPDFSLDSLLTGSDEPTLCALDVPVDLFLFKDNTEEKALVIGGVELVVGFDGKNVW